MLELLLASLFVSFFLALFSFPIEVVTAYLPAIVVNATFSLSLSVVSNLLIGFPVRTFILRVVATAFVSRVLLAAAEKVTDYPVAVVNSARQ